MSTPIKPYEEISHQLGASKVAWERLIGYIRFNYVMDELWAGKNGLTGIRRKQNEPIF